MKLRGKRRWMFGAGALSLFGTLAPHGAAETELEAAAYAGQSTGAWTCGPHGQARYAGVAGQLRYSERAANAREGRGGTVVIGGGLEDERVRILPGGEGWSTELDPQQHPPTSIHSGFGFRAGNDWRDFGFQLGALGYSAWPTAHASRPSGYVFPQLEFRAGRQDLFWASVGLGSPLATTYRRPGAYLGLGLKRGEHEVDATLGTFRAGPSGLDDTNTRLDLVWKGLLWSSWGPRVGVGFSDRAELSALDWEASLGVAASL